MKRPSLQCAHGIGILGSIALAASLLAACSLPLPSAIEPPQGETPIAQPTAELALPGQTASFGGVSLTLDPNVAAAASGASLPDTSDQNTPPDYDKGPARVVLALDGYAGPTTTVPALVTVYNVADLAGTPEEVVASGLTAILQERPDLAGQQQLPFLPILNAGQGLHARETYRDFASGSGIEYIALYGQDAYPLTAERLWYTFQGMTSDGRQLVSVVLPLKTDLFPAQLPADFNYDEWFAGYDQYIADSRQALAEAPADRFSPSLDLLTALVQSIRIAPQAAAEPGQQSPAVPADGSFAGTYSATLPAADTPGRAISMTLALDGSASMSTDYLNGEPAIVETGTWQDNGDGTATVTFTHVGAYELATPDVITFAWQDGMLKATGYDLEAYGTEGLTLQPGDAGLVAVLEPAPVEPAVPAGDNTSPQPVAPAGPVAPIAPVQPPAAPGQPAAPNELTGVTWQLQEIRRGGALASPVADPSKYTLAFGPSGDLSMVIDCNTGSGVYQVDGDEISFKQLTTTRAACPPPSLATQFTKVLEFVDSYTIDAGNLILSYSNGAGSLRFAPANSPETDATTPTQTP